MSYSKGIETEGDVGVGYINELFVIYNNKDYFNICDMGNIKDKVFFLSFLDDNKNRGIGGLCIPVRLDILKDKGENYIGFSVIRGFLEEGKYECYKGIKDYIKEINYKNSGDTYLNNWFISPLIVSVALENSAYGFMHLSDNLGSIVEDYNKLTTN